MDWDYLYFHFANLGLVFIGLLSVQHIASPWVLVLLIPGTVIGFAVSWYIKDSRPPHIDTFIGMLSLASVIIILSGLYDLAISFENIIRIFSTALAWLCLFQSFGLKTGKSYAILQFIAICLLISSVSLALEQETVYVVYLTIFLFIFVFTMRLNLMCEHKRKGSLIIGNRDEVMGLWQQLKVGAVMFSIVLLLSAIVYPLVPRFNSLSLTWLPSTLWGLPERIPILRLLQYADNVIKENIKAKKEQRVIDAIKKREAEGSSVVGGPIPQQLERREEQKEPTIERFQAKEVNKNIDILKIESLEIKTDKTQVHLDQKCTLRAELKMNDGTVIPATRLVDWKVVGTAKVNMDKDGTLTPKETGTIQVSASYMGSFSNDLTIKVIEPLKPKKKRSFWYYLLIILLWMLIAAFLLFFIWLFRRVNKLRELYENEPRGFIRAVYEILCISFRAYGIRKLIYMACREFYNIARELCSARPEPMYAITENVLEAGFSEHEITRQHANEAIRLFHEIKDVVLEKEVIGKFWRGLLFKFLILDVLLVSIDRESFK